MRYSLAVGESPRTDQPESPFDVLYRAVHDSPTLSAIYQRAFEREWPALQGQTSFVTQHELSIIGHGLRLSSGGRLVDLGCGAGGPGLWIANAYEASVIGVDSSTAAIAAAERLANGRKATNYRVADMTNTGLSAGSFDAVVSFDALQVLPDPRRAIAEAARLLSPGARFAFTTWESSPPTGAPREATSRFIDDYRPVLEASGFEVVHHSEPDGWKERQLAVSRGVLARHTELTRELGSAAYELLCEEAREDAHWLEATRARRVVVVCSAGRRPARPAMPRQ
ncbi:MAG: class I SAM-dependent methyltransferase [Myxococcales bacterium]|nr:class I SAM-dependent methyltransferase [Myxococcales bacterium]